MAHPQARERRPGPQRTGQRLPRLLPHRRRHRSQAPQPRHHHPHNENARRIQEAVQNRPGQPVKELSERLDIHSGTVRWHLRKLRDYGLVDELVREDGSQFFGTPLGGKAIEAVLGAPTQAPVRRAGARLPVAE